MLVPFLLLFLTTINVPVFGETVALEWSLGQYHPVAKVINSGTEQDLYCSVKDVQSHFMILLQCPAQDSICMQNCVPNDDNLYISCTNMSTTNMLMFHYKIKVFKKHEGAWRCQYGSETSRTVQLTVTNKPYISSFSAIPNPVWKGTLVNITCEVMPLYGINMIQISRMSNDNVTMPIPSDYVVGSNHYSDSVIINSTTPDKEINMQCNVFTNNGMISTKLLKINIFYFPKQLVLASSSSEQSFPVGFLLSFQCSSDGGNPRPVLQLYRQRRLGEQERLVDTTILLSKLDNGATFHCKVAKVAGVSSRLESNRMIIKVKYPPDNIELQEDPSGQLLESQIQTFVCAYPSGSEPPSVIEWSMTDHFGRRISSRELDRMIERVKLYQDNSTGLKDTIRLTIIRNLNGFKISCSIIYNDKRMLTQERGIKVAFAPNSITLNSSPHGAVVHGTSIILTCTTGTANPPSKIQWSKTKPGKKSEDVTSHSNMDLVPANYSGVAILSTLSIHDVTKSDHGNLYRCIVSHAYINSEIVKEYFVNVLFPPIVKVYSYPKSIEEGDQAHLSCRTTGGNPNILSLYRFQWKFCPVKSTYQLPSNSQMEEKPTSDIRKHCYQHFNGLGFQQSQTLNISSVSSKQRGWYSCSVQSPGGPTTGYSFLDVLYPPILTKQIPERIYGKTSTDAILKLEVLSNPLDIDVKWFFRPQQKISSGSSHEPLYDSKVQSISASKYQVVMKPFGRFESIVFDNYTVVLVIRSLSFLDYGDYFCEVANRMGKKSIQFQLFATNDITIPEASISMQFSGRNVLVTYEPPAQGHFTHLILRICSRDVPLDCKDMHISNPLSGKASTTVHQSPASLTYRILVYNGTSLLQLSNPIQRTFAPEAGHWVEMSYEMMVAVIIGVVVIFLLLFTALLTLILLKCKHQKSKEDLFVENNSILTANSHRRHDYFLLNSSANTTLMKNGCHCFPNYPMELRSDNGSDHSAPSQDTRLYHPIMMRRKIRDNGEMNSVHSGGSCQNPDVVLTEKTSLGSGNDQNFSGTPQFSSLGGSTPNKVSFLSGRLHSFDGQRPNDISLPEDFPMPQNMVFAAVDDGTSQTRLIPITAKNMHAEYPLYFQINNHGTLKPYDNTPPPHYSMSLPRCTKPCRNEAYRENSSSTNTDSNQYSAANYPSVVEPTNGPVDIRSENIN